MIDIKMHFGILFVMMFVMYGFYFFKDDLRDGYGIGIPARAALLLFGIAEVFSWGCWFFFVS